MIKNFEQFKTYFYLYLLYKGCDEDEEELFFNLEYLRRQLAIYLMFNPYVVSDDSNVYGKLTSLDDLEKYYLLKGKI